MKPELIYVEKSNGSNHDGDAWIGKCSYSKTGLSIYFDGKAFKKSRNFSSNYYDLDSGEEYWISGIKKDGSNRHKFGKGLINIDKSVIDEYLTIIGESNLSKTKFNVVELINIPNKELATEIENETKDDFFDFELRFKKPENLKDLELIELINYYDELDLNRIPKKSRKLFLEQRKKFQHELSRRKSSNLA
jgi:hypothetical protein